MTTLINKKATKILKELQQYKTQDYSFQTGRILGSMCTQPHPIALQAYIQFLDTNLGDPELFPGAQQIEQKLLSFIGNLLHLPRNGTGQIVSGGTEGNITAIWIAKQLTKKKDIIIPQSAHFSLKKIALLMDMNLIQIPVTQQHTLNVAEIKQHITKNTAAILGIAGSTELGTIDPIPELSDLCNEEHVFLHVDAAFGGYIIPFLKLLNYNLPEFDFNLPGVSTISIDAHKMGYSAIPLGALMIRNKQWLDTISVESPCISTTHQTGILGTRSGGPVAAAYAVSQYLGIDGYKQMIKACMDNTTYFVDKITELGLLLVIKPTINVIGVRLRKLDQIVNKLARQGWRVNKIQHLSCIRIVIMPQITKNIIDEFIPIFKKTCQEVGEL